MLYKIISKVDEGSKFIVLQYCFLNTLLLKCFSKSFPGDYKQACNEMEYFLTLKILRGEISRDKIFKIGRMVAKQQCCKGKFGWRKRGAVGLISKVYLQFLLDEQEKNMLRQDIKRYWQKNKITLYTHLPSMETSYDSLMLINNLQ